MERLSELDISGKRVFVRVGIDVDPKEAQRGLRSARLIDLKPTVDYVGSHDPAKIILAGKIGRPGGKIDPSLSVGKIKGALEEVLNLEIAFMSDLDGELEAPVVLLENLHFWPGELEPSMDFAKKLARLADVYVNEAFASCHRNEASISLLPTLLPHAAGIRLKEEVRVLTKLLESPVKPLITVIGGTKIETKLPVIHNLSKISQQVLVGGMLVAEVEKTGQTFPENVLVAKLTEDGLDIDLESVHQFVRLISVAKTVVWNGPMGLFEKGHDVGSKAVANAILESGAYSVVGGGETTQFLEKEGLLSRFSFVSVGGGAMLEFLAGGKLPGIRALD